MDPQTPPAPAASQGTEPVARQPAPTPMPAAPQALAPALSSSQLSRSIFAIIALVLLVALTIIYLVMLRPHAAPTAQSTSNAAPSLAPADNEPSPTGLGATLYAEASQAQDPFADATTANPIASSYQNPFSQ